MADTYESALEFFKQAEQQGTTEATGNETTNAITLPSSEALLNTIKTDEVRGALLQRAATDTTPRTQSTLNAAERVLLGAGDVMKGVLAPVTSAMSGIERKNLVATPEGRAILGEEKGILFDPYSGVGFMSRLAEQMALNRDEVKAMLLRSNPNAEDVRFNALGEPVLRIKDPQTGEAKDVLANPVGIDPGDFAFLAANAPQMIAGAVAARGVQLSGQAISGLQKAARIILGSRSVLPSAARMAVAGEAAGAASDLLGRTTLPGTSAIEPNISGVLEKRGSMALADMVFGIGLGLTAKAGGRVISPFSERGPLQVNAEAAQDFWRAQGVYMPLSPAERTGNSFLLRMEAYQAAKPGSSGVYSAIQDVKIEAVDRVQRIMLGSDPSLLPPEDRIGQNALEALGGKVRPIYEAVDVATANVLEAAQRDIQLNVAQATKIPQPLAESAVGSGLLARAQQIYDDFRSASRQLYDQVYSDPRVAGRNIDATPLANDARAILDAMPSVQQPDGLHQFSSFVDSTTRAKLQQLADAQGGQMGLRDLIELRRDIDDDLFRGSALGGIPERRLSDIRNAITKRIQTGLNDLDPSGKLRQSWETANQHYADNIQKFKDVDIVNFYKDAQQRGALGLNQIVDRAVSDPDYWRSYRDFFGAASNEMNQLRRVFADRIIGRTEGSEIVNLEGFANRIERAFTGKTGEIAEDVFGAQSQNLLKLSRVIKEARKGIVDADALAREVQSGTLTEARLRALEQAQIDKSQVERDAMLKRIAEGEPTASVLQPSKFVDNFILSDKVEPENVAELMARLGDRKDVQSEIAQRTLFHIFNDSMGGPVGKETITAVGLDKYLNDPLMVRKLQTVVGDTQVKRLQMLRDALKPGETKERMFRSAGGIAGGMLTAEFEREFGSITGTFGVLSKLLRSFAMAALYRVGPLGRALTNTLVSPKETAAFANLVVAGTPVAIDLVKFFGQEGGTISAQQIKKAIDIKAKGQGSTSGMNREEALKFFQQAAP